jgi:hypothetical protein
MVISESEGKVSHRVIWDKVIRKLAGRLLIELAYSNERA